MNTRENSFARRKKLGLTMGFVQRRRALAGIAAILIGASFVFSGSASAHNIDVKKAREVAREYARTIRDQSKGNYIHFSTNCVAAFPGHNHIVRCLIDYKNAKDSAAGVYTCREGIELFLYPHGSSNTYNYEVNIRHTSGTMCGARQPNVTYV